MKIFIDPGHNYSGKDTGASGYGLREELVSFAIADKLRGMLTELGNDVKMSRNSERENVGTGSVQSSINGRVKMANDWGADIFISIHCNAYDKTAHGTETLVYSRNSEAEKIAQRVQSAIINQLGTVNRGIVERKDLGVLRLTNCPAILVETAFIDNEADAWLFKTRAEDFAAAICEGLTGQKVQEKEEKQVARTVMELPEKVYIQEINPIDFEIMMCDCAKKDVTIPNYFNCGYFAVEKGGKTVPVGNLANNGEILAQAKDNADWLNLAGHKLTTIYTLTDGTCGICKTDDLATIRGLKTAVSGIPIIVGGKYVSLDEIKSEGYFGNELYNTWHGFLGIRHGKLVYVAMQCGFDGMCWALVALGIYDAVKLDGGGSFILKNGGVLQATSENRRIHNVGVWKN